VKGQLLLPSGSPGTGSPTSQLGLLFPFILQRSRAREAEEDWKR
jgi:hypothetical protein